MNKWKNTFKQTQWSTVYTKYKECVSLYVDTVDLKTGISWRRFVKDCMNPLFACWHLKCIFGACVLVSLAAVNTESGKTTTRVSQIAGMLRHAAVAFWLPQWGAMSSWAHTVLRSEKQSKWHAQNKQPILRTALYCISLCYWWILFRSKFSPRVRSVVKRTVSGNGFWSSQDIIMRYQLRRMACYF